MSARRTHRLFDLPRWFRLVLLTTCAGCASDKPPAAATCCEQPQIPAGVPSFKVVTDEGSGPSDGRKVILRVALAQPVKRDEVYPVLHTLYRHAMQRTPFEPIQFSGEVYANESAARDGGDVQMLARISRGQSQSGPQCENRIAYNFAEQVARAFDASMGRLPQQDLDDTCRLATPKSAARVDEGFKNKASYKLDDANKSVAITYPYLEMGKDQYVEKLKLSSALGDWIDLTSSLFRKVPDLASLTFSGMHDDSEVVRISMSRKQFDEDFSGLQEQIAAHAAVTFQSLGTGRSSDKAAEKEQETFKVKTYKEALALLPKNQVTISPKLLKG
ncbi:MAG TPA: hypothetical protein VGF45_00545, partial [Polyangia bacterium]